jgi:hypothetical protein
LQTSRQPEIRGLPSAIKDRLSQRERIPPLELENKAIVVLERPSILPVYGLGCVGVHCTENQIYVFPKKKLRGPSPNSYIHMSMSD